MHKRFDAVIFVYRVEGQADFWAPSGEQFCRFALVGAHYRLVRCQPTLPPRAVGGCAGVSRAEQRQLAAEAKRSGHCLAFFETLQDCERHVSGQQASQYIFDRALPAGVYSLEGIIYSGDREG